MQHVLGTGDYVLATGAIIHWFASALSRTRLHKKAMCPPTAMRAVALAALGTNAAAAANGLCVPNLNTLE